jgi:hypothetical protein
MYLPVDVLTRCGNSKCNCGIHRLGSGLVCLETNCSLCMFYHIPLPKSQIYHCLQARASHLEKFDNITEKEAKAMYGKKDGPEVVFEDDETDYLYTAPPKTGT